MKQNSCEHEDEEQFVKSVAITMNILRYCVLTSVF